MQELNLSAKIKKNLSSFVSDLGKTYGPDLISIILYGSAASGEFTDAHSNLNVLVVLKKTDLESLKKITGLFRKFPLISPLFFTESAIADSTDIFPIEFLDMQENYAVLSGKDLLKNIHIETRNLRFQCEQELRLKLLHLKQRYLRVYRDKGTLRNLLFKSFTSSLHILRNVLRLKGKYPPYLKQEILKELSSELNINLSLWEKILSAKQGQIKLGGEEIEELFEAFIIELEKIVDLVDKL